MTEPGRNIKFRAVGSSTQAFCHAFTVRTVGDWNSLPSHVVEQSTTASFNYSDVYCQDDIGRIRTVKRHPPFTRYSTRRTVNYLSESESVEIWTDKIWTVKIWAVKIWNACPNA